MAGTNDADRATIARLAEEVLPTLIERLAKSQLGELEVRESGWRIRLRRSDGETAQGSHASSAQAAAHRSGSAAHVSHTTSEGHAPRREQLRGVITSPAVGYFSPRGGLAAGINVRRGDVIGVVDVLGVRQDVVSPSDGVLKALDVEPGGAVEYGQPIGRVEVSVQ